MKKSALLTALLLSVLFSQAQYLNILDPQNWRQGQGTIEETRVTYEPHGLYMKVDWEIVFSAKGLNFFSENDTVEVEYHFQLPKNALVTDSWLWFGDTILKGEIMDRWSASQIYETIVSRRRDPSILFKNSNTNYELRIFPMAAKKSRKVKLTFLMPVSWSTNSVSAFFPSENLMASKNAIGKIDVFTKLENRWSNPILEGNGIENFSEFQGENGVTHHAILDHDQLNYDLRLTLNSPLQNGTYLTYFENGGDKFYQLAVLPLKSLELENPQKILFLFDYREGKSDISQTELLNSFAQNLTNMFSEKDSFNILYHGVYNGFELQKASESWLSGDSLSIASAVSNMGEEPFVSYSNLATLLAEGIEMAKAGNNAKIVLIANSDNLDNVRSANDLLSDLMKLANPKVPVYIADFQTDNYTGYHVNNIWYRGNEYFYQNLARLTGGDYCNALSGKTFAECFNTVYQSAASENGMIDVHTTLHNGFCYGRFNPGQQQNVFSNLPFLEIGKYNGEFPFEIDVSGEYAGELFSNKISIEKEDAVEADSITKKVWIGNEIIELEKSATYHSYGIINEIIDKSLENRILTRYTAFLCLEPGMLDEFNENEETNEQTTEAEKISTPDSDINIYPNPFRDRVNIEITVSEETDRSQIKLEIYDLFGKLIKTFDADQYDNLSEIKIQWDATNQNGIRLPEGTYLFVCTTPNGRISKRLVVM